MGKEIGSLAKGYLVLYNAALSVGWLVVLVQMVQHLIKTNGQYEGVYDAVDLALQVFQTAALMEVVHAMIGIVHSSAALTFMQVLSRIVVLWPVLHYTPGVEDTVGPVLMITCWAVTEIIRYAFYVCSLVGSTPYALLWCRYTFFYLLYPLGVTGELICIHKAFFVARETQLFSAPLPNRLNMSFDYATCLVIFALLYIPIFPQLYFHMIRQRGKQLGKAKTA